MVYDIMKIHLSNSYFALYKTNAFSARHVTAWLVYNFLLSPHNC